MFASLLQDCVLSHILTALQSALSLFLGGMWVNGRKWASRLMLAVVLAVVLVFVLGVALSLVLAAALSIRSIRSTQVQRQHLAPSQLQITQHSRPLKQLQATALKAPACRPCLPLTRGFRCWAAFQEGLTEVTAPSKPRHCQVLQQQKQQQEKRQQQEQRQQQQQEVRLQKLEGQGQQQE
jgi:MFS superfamily sulfate permease-like transporter